MQTTFSGCSGCTQDAPGCSECEPILFADADAPLNSQDAPDAVPNSQDAPDAAPNPQGKPDAAPNTP